MMRRIAFALMTLGTLGLLAAGCGVVSSMDGSGVAARQVRNLPAFSSIRIGHGFDAVITIRPEQSVVLEGDDNLLAMVATEVEGDWLVVRPAEKGVWLRPEVGLVLHVAVPRLDELEASGGADVKLNGLTQSELEIEAGGGAELEAREIHTETLEVEVSGGADVILVGNTEELEVEVSGGADLDAEDLSATHIEIRGSGGSDARLRAVESITGSLSGGADACYKGEPGKIKVDTSGAASIRPC